MPGPGRPSDYTQELARAICVRLADGESLRSVCRDEDMPAESTVRGWVIDDREGFSAQYARARESGMDAMADEILEIADDRGADVVVDEEGKATVNGEVVQRSRLRVDTRKWLMSKIAPKRFGEKITQEVTGADGAPLVPIINLSGRPEPSSAS